MTNANATGTNEAEKAIEAEKELINLVADRSLLNLLRGRGLYTGKSCADILNNEEKIKNKLAELENSMDVMQKNKGEALHFMVIKGNSALVEAWISMFLYNDKHPESSLRRIMLSDYINELLQAKQDPSIETTNKSKPNENGVNYIQPVSDDNTLYLPFIVPDPNNEVKAAELVDKLKKEAGASISDIINSCRFVSSTAGE